MEIRQLSTSELVEFAKLMNTTIVATGGSINEPGIAAVRQVAATRLAELYKGLFRLAPDAAESE